MNPNFNIAIPSYRRPKECAGKTIAFLESHSIPPNKIYVFVSDRSELEAYQSAIGTKAQVIPGIKTLRGNRKAISSFFKEGNNVLCLDDDVKQLHVRIDEKNTKPLENLTEFTNSAFEECRKNSAALWGVYPVNNPYFMKQKKTFALKYIVGAFYGIINTKDELMQVTMDDFEDFERTILFYQRDGKVMRIEDVCVETDYYATGGMNAEGRTDERRIKFANLLIEKYPGLCHLNTRKKSAHGADITLKDTRYLGDTLEEFFA